jgi:hypothetical protein
VPSHPWHGAKEISETHTQKQLAAQPDLMVARRAPALPALLLLLCAGLVAAR